MDEYTKGPWKYVYDPNYEVKDIPNAVMCDEYYIASIYTSGCGSKEQAKANARLIACAPELLEMLENAANIIGLDEPEFYGCAMNLIAKAKGEQNC